MLKKLTLACALITTSITTAHAAFYAGPLVGLTSNTSPNGNFRAIQPIIAIGYSEMVSTCTYLAIEAFGSPTSLMLDDNTPGGSSLRSTYSLGASFIPGYLITDNVIGYLRLGIVTTKFEAPNTVKTGGQVGLGLQTGLTDEWQLRFEYDYSAFKSAPEIGSVKTDQVLLGLIYNFIL